MRLPADATLIVVDPGGPSAGPHPPLAGSVAANVAALIAVWRREELPLVRARPLAAGAERKEPADDEGWHERAVALGAFGATGLEDLLEEIGATTLVLCGASEEVAASARDAVALGYQVFVVADACPSATAGLEVEGAALVDAATALGAAAMAKFRLRWRAERARVGPRNRQEP